MTCLWISYWRSSFHLLLFTNSGIIYCLCEHKLVCSLICTSLSSTAGSGNVHGIESVEFDETFSTFMNIEQYILVINLQAVMVQYNPQISYFVKNLQRNMIPFCKYGVTYVHCSHMHRFPSRIICSFRSQKIVHVNNVGL